MAALHCRRRQGEVEWGEGGHLATTRWSIAKTIGGKSELKSQSEGKKQRGMPKRRGGGHFDAEVGRT